MYRDIFYALDENGEPYPTHASDPILVTQDRRVALDTVGNYRVSTVFLGVNHRFDENGPPVLWETMVFGPDDYMDRFCERYTSKQDAIDGHNRVVESLKRGSLPLNDDDE